MLEHTYFIHPGQIRDSRAVFSNFVRESKEHHPNKRKNDVSTWNGREVTVYDNTKARLAFGQLAGEKMGGDSRTVAKGWDVAHIWGRVFDPDCFTAGWNICLMPNWLRDLTEKQNDLPFFQTLLKQAAYDLYFRNTPVFDHSIFDFIKNENIEIAELYPEWNPNLVKPRESRQRRLITNSNITQDEQNQILNICLFVTEDQILRLQAMHDDPNLNTTGSKIYLSTNEAGYRFEVEKPNQNKIDELQNQVQSGRLVLSNLVQTNRANGNQYHTQFGGCYVVVTEAFDDKWNYVA